MKDSKNVIILLLAAAVVVLGYLYYDSQRNTPVSMAPAFGNS